MALYELAILGNATTAERKTLTATIGRVIGEFGMVLGGDVVIRGSADVASRDPKAAAAAAWFGGADRSDLPDVVKLLKARIPVVPTVRVGLEFSKQVPVELQSTNGSFRRADDTEMEELASVLLECAGLLRKQRRVFVSYRRDESRGAAMQLWERFGARGFTAFLDTHEIRPGKQFQDELWHQLCDCDVMVMLDTPGYFKSKWTRAELGRARSKEIHVVRVIWPDNAPVRSLEFGMDFSLRHEDLMQPSGPLAEDVADAIVTGVEKVRSRSIASRYRSISGKLREAILAIGGTVDGIGAHRAIAVGLPDDSTVWVYPTVGVPTAEIFNDIAEKAERADQQGAPVLIYDGMGLRDSWRQHLDWLRKNIKTVRSIPVAELGWMLVAPEGEQ